MISNVFDECFSFQALIETNFLWDSSISTKTTDKPIWPYTLDYAIPHECKIKSCPNKAYPGVWEIPVNLHYIEGLSAGQCSYLDQCVFALQGANDVFEWLKEDFRRHYDVSIFYYYQYNSTKPLKFGDQAQVTLRNLSNVNSQALLIHKIHLND